MNLQVAVQKRTCKSQEEIMIVDSLWLYGFLGVAGFIIIYLADH